MVAYTPMHGVGALSVEAAMAAAGVKHLHVEPSQRKGATRLPDRGDNPEEKGAMDRVLALATKVKADVVLANDPDADRLCCAVPDGTGNGYRVFTGDQVGSLMADYLTREVRPQGQAAGRDHDRCRRSCSNYLAKLTGADYRETLTGFKWLGNAAMDYERDHHGRFVMGYEEALGYSVGALVRDKDGVSATMIFASELVAMEPRRGRSVLEHLDDIYRKVGLFVTEQVSLTSPAARA